MGILRIIFAFFIFCSPAWAAAVTVCDSGCDYGTVALALAGVGSGAHTITVTGTYTAEAAFTITASGTSVGAELTITSSEGHSLPAVTIGTTGGANGRYVKLHGFKFTAGAAGSGHLRINGHDAIVDGCTFRQVGAAYYDGAPGSVQVEGERTTFTNNDIRNSHHKTFMLLNTSSYAVISGNTLRENCNGSDMFYVFGHDHTFRQNTLYDNTYYGVIRQDGETLEVGECRSTTGTPGQSSRYWEVTTAGETGTGEPSNFEMTTLPGVGSTLSDGTVTWTAREHSGQHPDIWQTFGDGFNGNSNSYNILIERNNVYHSARSNIGTTGANGTQLGNLTQDGNLNVKDWIFRNNIFGASRAINLALTGVEFYNNTFIGTIYHEQPPINIGCTLRVGCSSGAKIKNNIFLGTGDTAVNPDTTGWYGVADPLMVRPRNTAIANATLIVPKTWEGYRFRQTLGACTTGDTDEPAALTIGSYSFTADVTEGSNTLTNVSSFVGIEYYMWLLNDTYVSNYGYIDDYNSSAGTITMKCSKSGETLCGMASGEGVSFTAKKNLLLYPSYYLEKLSNHMFDVNTTSWEATNATLAVDDSGVYGKALKITATSNGGKAYQTIIDLTASTEYALLIHHKNTAGDVAQYGIYDVSNSEAIVSATDLPDSTSWSAWKKVVFSTPAGCTSIRIDLLAKTDTDVVYFDNVSVRPNAADYRAGSSQYVVDGTCLWMAEVGAEIPDADYNYVSKRSALSYAAKTYFTGKETHGVSGGDPKLTNESTRDYSLTAGSTILIGKGADLSSEGFTNDYTGNTRTGTWDIGAYEYYEQGNKHGVTSMGVSKK